MLECCNLGKYVCNSKVCLIQEHLCDICCCLLTGDSPAGWRMDVSGVSKTLEGCNYSASSVRCCSWYDRDVEQSVLTSWHAYMSQQEKHMCCYHKPMICSMKCQWTINGIRALELLRQDVLKRLAMLLVQPELFLLWHVERRHQKKRCRLREEDACGVTTAALH